MRRLMTFVLLLSLLVAAPSHAATDSTPSDPLASQATKDLLARLANLPNQSGQRLISGQWGDWNGITAAALARLDTIHTMSGQWVGLVGVTAWKSSATVFTLGNSAQNLIVHWTQGGLIQITPFWPNPETGNPASSSPQLIAGSFADIYTDNDNALNLAFKGYMDTFATGVQLLADAGAPVLINLFSEMNQPYFWWGASGTNVEYIALWQYTFNYLVTTKGLHNLLFVYAPFYQGFDNSRYPGDAYVDVVGIDLYNYDAAPAPLYTNGKANGYDTLVATGKPFAAVEFGLQHYGADPPKDVLAGIAKIKTAMPEMVYFMAWNENWALDKQLNVSAALNDPWVANRDAVVTPPPPPPLSATIGWNASNDNVGVAGYNVLRCTIAPCTPTDVLASITAPAVTYVDTTIVQGQSYSYAVNAYDAAGNISANSAPVDFGLVSTVRHTLATDTFDRTNNTDLGVSWDAGYTGQNNAQIISNQIRGTSTASSAVETYNVITTPNDQWIQATLATWGTGAARGALLVRMANSPTWNGYACIIRDTTPLFSIERRDGGVGTVLATTDAVTPVAGDAYRCEIQGTTLRFVRIVGTVETQLLTATDATYPTGKTGVHINNQTDTANTELDNVVIGGFATSTQSPSIP